MNVLLEKKTKFIILIFRIFLFRTQSDLLNDIVNDARVLVNKTLLHASSAF